MNYLINEIMTLLNNRDFEFAVCGGYSIELFLDKEIRPHGDIDISAYWVDRDKIILYMKSLGWDIYEMCGDGIAHKIRDVTQQLRIKRNIFCIKGNCELVKLYPRNEADMFYLEFDGKGQTEPNFIEFLFNNRTETNFLYARNTNITRVLSKAILKRNDIPFLAPEIVLLYKSTDIGRIGYQLDYEEAIRAMDIEQKAWLASALNVMYPAGHQWANTGI